MKLLLILVICLISLSNGQEADESTDQGKLPGLLGLVLPNTNPIQRLADRFGIQQRVEPNPLRNIANRTILKAQQIVEEVRGKANVLENRLKQQIHNIRLRMKVLNDRLKNEREDKREDTQTKINELKVRIEKAKDKFINELQDQKDVIEERIEVMKQIETEFRSKLEEEVLSISEKIKETEIIYSLEDIAGTIPVVGSDGSVVNQSNVKPNQTIIPEIRGLGDGYGRHL